MRIGLFKFTFRTSGAMHLAAERLAAFASQNPTLMSHNDPPLVLWTDDDLVDGRSLYTTEIGRRFIATVISNAPPSVVLSPEDLHQACTSCVAASD